MGQNSILDIIEETGTIFKQKEVFQHDYLPENFKYRDMELEQMAIASRGLKSGYKPDHLHLNGTYATGKTTTLLKYFEVLKENFDNVLPVYISCPVYRTEYKVFTKIYKELFGSKVKTSRLNTFDIYDKVLNKIIRENIVLIVGLDDYDSIKSSRDLNRTLYTLLRAHESYVGAKISIITVTSRPKQIMDPSVSTTFTPTEIKFDPYTPEQLYDIISERCRLGFYSGVIDDDIIRAVSGYSYNQGDLREGLKLLNSAGEKAEIEGCKRLLKRYLL